MKTMQSFDPPANYFIDWCFNNFCHLIWYQYINGLVQDCSNSIANALELLQSCTKPSIWFPWQFFSEMIT